MKIPKEVVEKIRQANELNNEICKWMDSELETEGMDFTPLFWNIVPEPQGEEQGDGEWCAQRQHSEDWFTGEHYYQLEGESNYLCMDFEIW